MGRGYQSTTASGPRQRRQHKTLSSSDRPHPPPDQRNTSVAHHPPTPSLANGRGHDSEGSDRGEARTLASSESESDFSDSDVGGANHK